jgi:proteasome lid subunit RPN8/RPN11
MLAQLQALARNSPVEICGLLLGRAGEIRNAVPVPNVSASPSDSFEIDPVILLACHRAARSGEMEVLGHFHSHPSGPAAPSERDAAASAVDGSLWLILAKDEARLWRAVSGGAIHGSFDTETIDLCD